MDISLPPDLEEYVRRKVASGVHHDAGEVVREALRVMRDRETGGRAAPDKHEIRRVIEALKPDLLRRGVRSAALFGSVVRGEARPDSDLDILVGLDPAGELDLVDLAGIRNLIADRLGREVDVIDRDGLKPGIRERILAEAEAVF